MGNPFAKLGHLVKAAAPTLGNVLVSAVPGGPLAKAAVGALAGAIGSNETDPDALAAQIAVDDPTQAAAIRAADQQFKIEVLRIHAADRADARKMQTATRSRTPQILAYLAIAGLFAYVGLWTWMSWQGASPDGTAENIFFFVVGLLGSYVSQAFNFYLGSSEDGGGVKDLLRRAKE